MMDIEEQQDPVNTAHDAGEAFHRAFVDATAGIAIKAVDGRFLDANAAYCRVLGYTAEELRGMAFPDVTHPDDRARNLEMLRALVEGRRSSFSMEKRYVAKDGRVVRCQVNVFAQRDAAGRPRGVVAVAEDLTEQDAQRAQGSYGEQADGVQRSQELKRANDQLAQNQTLLRIAGRVARLGGWSVTVPDFVVSWSDETAVIHDEPAGFSPSLETAIKYYAPEYRQVIRSSFEACVRDGTPYDIEARIVTAKGRQSWVRAIGEALRDEAGRIVCVQGAFQDITAQKEAELSLAESQRRFRQLADSMPFIVWTAEPDGTIDFSNRCFFEYAGVSPDAQVANHWQACLHEEDRPACLQAWSEMIREQKPLAIEYRLRRADGQHRWFRGQASAARDATGKLVKWYGTSVDIDDTKRLAREATRFAERLTATLESITDAFFTVDLDWRFSYVNAEGERLLRRSRNELLGRNVWEAFPAAADSTFEREYRRAIAERRTVSFEEYYAPYDAWLEVRAYPSAEGLAVYFRDVTERRRSREALHVSEERFRLLSRATNAAIWDWDLVGDALWWSDGFEKLFGFDRATVEPTNGSWFNRIHPEDRESVMSDVQAAVDGAAESWIKEYRFRCSDGSYAYVLNRGYIIRNEEGRAVRMIGGMTDVTPRRLIEEQLRDQATLLDHAQDAIFVQDPAYQITYWNRAAERLFGWTRREAIGRRVDEVLRLEASVLDARMTELLAQGSWKGELDLFSRLGERRTVASRWSVLRSERGEPRGVLVINTDVTQQKSIEAQLLRAQRLESIGTLAGGIAHDLNNVLTPILSAVAMLREGEADPDKLDDLATLESCAQRGSDLVRRMLTFARGSHEGARSRVNLVDIANEVLKMMRDTFPRDMTPTLTTGTNVWPVKADPTQMHQLLTNLCVNARDAMPNGGSLTLAVEGLFIDEVYAGMNVDAKPGPYVLVRVEDTGTGMPQEIMDRIFEPFFTTKEVGKGTGLGLSTCHAIVRSHGGFIHVYSEVGKGTRFKIYLPADIPGGASRETLVEHTSLPRGKGELVLVVDDEESIRKVTARTLERYGYRVLTATNGAEAVSIYARHTGAIAVVLTDMSMPIMDGPRTIVALKAMDPNVRIIGSSGLDANGKVAKALGAGVSHFVPKPYTAEALLQMLRRVLG